MPNDFPNDTTQNNTARTFAELEAEETAYLRPATERLRAERLRIEAQNAALKILIAKEERFARRLERFLAAARAERHALETERERILSAGASS